MGEEKVWWRAAGSRNPRPKIVTGQENYMLIRVSWPQALPWGRFAGATLQNGTRKRLPLACDLNPLCPGP